MTREQRFIKGRWCYECPRCKRWKPLRKYETNKNTIENYGYRTMKKCSQCRDELRQQRAKNKTTRGQQGLVIKKMPEEMRLKMLADAKRNKKI